MWRNTTYIILTVSELSKGSLSIFLNVIYSGDVVNHWIWKSDNNFITSLSLNFLGKYKTYRESVLELKYMFYVTIHLLFKTLFLQHVPRYVQTYICTCRYRRKAAVKHFPSKRKFVHLYFHRILQFITSLKSAQQF
jgi:hypothetical protein